ncbi:hypothetical protein CRG98_001568 [Punica granatum]|uniref:Uncharacterized protein n=1 Tax=Punica granatum TaxID=22663 RepID=A0A2I0LB86_PUNGR|nr:hypothetical protein CRG98_001568 [Punica granatum]
MKAFESTDWDFLKNIFQAIGMPTVFIDWVFECVARACYSVLVNGGLEGYFQGKKRLRQGDHLFVMAIEVLSKLLNRVVVNGLIAYYPYYKRLQLIHLGFADDLMMYGLILSLAKSEIYCAGMEARTVNEILDLSGFKWGSSPVRYLGVPLIAGEASASQAVSVPVQLLTPDLQTGPPSIPLQVGSFILSFIVGILSTSASSFHFDF